MDHSKELKLIWLIKVAQNSHYKCEYRQDGTPRLSVKCGGCSASTESNARRIRDIVDFVGKIAGKQS